ncbi:hypothetical protein ADS79_00910 [Brevibacillus reuszeri]|uniref:Uncharacterized protein n=1 Tax=Brevibacillus reuszeri TaxID=54915 RepID=A0A0K9Z056_9BACL|nr:hypothetical protein ADS79_00910 [Brevibacillus reuszeri]
MCGDGLGSSDMIEISSLSYLWFFLSISPQKSTRGTNWAEEYDETAANKASGSLFPKMHEYVNITLKTVQPPKHSFCKNRITSTTK